MFNGKLKALTFSFDDGVIQDKRLIELLDEYNLKATFNLNSELLGITYRAEQDGVKIVRPRIKAEEVKEVYKNHEVAVHTLTHVNLTECDEAEIIRQVEKDKENLERLVGYEIVGMAYPCGGINNDERVVDIIKNKTGIKYARTTVPTLNFDVQKDLITFNPTGHQLEKFDELAVLCEKFIEMDATEPQILYIWAHSYEYDEQNAWDKIEGLCKLIANKKDIFYGTNKEVLLGLSL